MRHYVVISDLQIPANDKVATRNLKKFIAKYKPDGVLCVGDEADLHGLSRWAQGTPAEYERTLGKDRDEVVETLYDLKVDHLVRSNHGDRLYNSIMKRVPNLLGAPELEYSRFFRHAEIGVTYHTKPYKIPDTDWVMVHGDEQAINSHGGLTALGASRRHGKSVVCGHTHRLGISSFSEASGGFLGRILTGFEVGHLMNEREAGYTKGTMNWQKGFGILYVHRGHVNPVPVYVEKDGSFVVEGKRFG